MNLGTQLIISLIMLMIIITLLGLWFQRRKLTAEIKSMSRTETMEFIYNIRKEERESFSDENVDFEKYQYLEDLALDHLASFNK